MIKLTNLLLYLAAAGLLLRAHRGAPPETEKAGFNAGQWLALLALSGHSFLLAQSLPGTDGIDLGIGNIVGLLGWQLGLFAVVTAGWFRLQGLSALFLPFAAVMMLFADPGARASADFDSPGWQMETHVVLSVLSFGLFSIGALLAGMMVLQETSIRRRTPGRLTRILPPLEAVEQSLFISIGIGFFLLSMAIFSGLVFVDNLFAQHLVHKTVLSLLAWLIFGALLIGRWRFGWRGTTAVRWTLGGFAALLLAYFGSRIVLEFILGREWG